MPLTTIRSPPILDSFTPLAEHQSQTPTTFYGAKPVLHCHMSGTHALVPKDQISKLPFFRAARALAQDGTAALESEQPFAAEVVDIFVSTGNLTIFNPANSTGLSIPYPAIALHAIQRLPNPENIAEEVQGLYMQLEMEIEPSSEDEELETVELTILPSLSADIGPGYTVPVQTLFEAVSACSNLHPDPLTQEDEDILDEDGDSRIVFEGNVGYEGISGLRGVSTGVSDGGLPPPFPGSGGWITADNVGQYFDEEGNWIGGRNEEETPLGEGAGRVRGRDEIDGEPGEASETRVNGHGKDGEEDNKRQRAE